jgi:hypothetical protein
MKVPIERNRDRFTDKSNYGQTEKQTHEEMGRKKDRQNGPPNFLFFRTG